MMKKSFLLLSLLMLALSVSAQQYRKSWDFTKWSAETVADLMTGSDWSDIEKANATAPTDLSKDNCFWEVTAMGNASGEVNLTANGNVIKELEGLWYTNTSSRSLAIAVNYQNANAEDAAFRDYHGASYLWLGSKKKNYFVIPHVEPGTTIKMGVESHKQTDARGVELYIGRGTSGTKLLAPDGSTNAVPTTYQEFEWLVPADATDTPNEDGTYDIQIYNTNGCHIYFITVGEGDEPGVEEAKQVAYVADPATVEEDLAYIFLSSADGINVTTINAAEAISLDSLQTYDVVAVAPSVKAEDALAPVLRTAVAYQPMLSLNAALAEAWGLVKAVPTTETTVTVAEEEADNKLFTDLDASALELLTEGGLKAVELGDYFAADKVIAKAGEAVAIHQHNPVRNSYLYLPYDAENLAAANQDVLPLLLVNAVNVLADTKAKVTPVVVPSIAQDNQNMATVVTISCGNKEAKVYYTLDGNDPTEASTLYTEPFTLTEPATVKAVAYADGYNASAVASLDVVIKSQAAAPAITAVNNADNTEITLSCATEGVDIYYSYNNIDDQAFAQKYTEPIVLREEPCTIYAFAAGGNYVQSEMSSQAISINSINAQTLRIDTLAHFDANETDWFVDNTENGGTGKASAYYYWGKSAWNYYSTEIDYEETVKDSEGNDSIIYHYKPDAAAVRVVNPNNENGWILKSAGQVLTGELQLAAEGKVGNGATGRYAETAEDILGGVPSKGAITFGGKTSGEPYTAAIESTVKFTAPFDVVTYIGNGNGSGAAIMQVEVSADGVTWDSVGVAKMAGTQRYYKKTRVNVEKSGEYYVRLAQVGGSTKAQVYDVYVLNNGEISQAYDPNTGIEGISGSAAEVLRSEVYSLNGMRVNQLQKGLNIIRQYRADGSVKTVKVMK